MAQPFCQYAFWCRSAIFIDVIRRLLVIQTISYAFLPVGNNPTDWQREPVEKAIVEYTRYANVKLTEKSGGETGSANI